MSINNGLNFRVKSIYFLANFSSNVAEPHILLGKVRTLDLVSGAYFLFKSFGKMLVFYLSFTLLFVCLLCFRVFCIFIVFPCFPAR